RDRSNRSGRGQVEHNVLEGLPINQYREVEVTLGLNQSEDKQADKDHWPELPLPRDFHMLPEHSQQLLRAARRGRVFKPPVPQEEDRENLDDEEEQKDVQKGFSVKKYIKIARHLEDAEPEYLAKRRKGLPSQYVPVNGVATLQQAPLRETKVKKLDAEGNVTVYKALVPEGQTVEGEVQPTDIIAEAAPVAAAPGTIVEGVGIVNAEGVVVPADLAQQTPPRRKPPPPKKKKNRGPGRGHKKVVFAEGSVEQGTPASGSDLLAVPGIKQEGGSVEPSVDGDTPMADAADEDEGDEGEEDEGSDHDDREDADRSVTPGQSATPSKSTTEPTAQPVLVATTESTPAAPEVPSAPAIDSLPLDVSAAADPPASIEETPAESTSLPFSQEQTTESLARDPSSSPDLPLISHSRQNSLNQLPTAPPLNLGSSLDEITSTETAITEPMVTEPIVAETVPMEPVAVEAVSAKPVPEEPAPVSSIVAETTITDPAPVAPAEPEIPQLEDTQHSEGEPDLLGDLERHLEKDSESMAGS
ncbi:hypothetical protein EJ04DRAFT_423092, partial [Polyplosphaeria fusca]